MRHYAALFLAVLGAGCWRPAATQDFQTLFSDNGISWRGDEGEIDICPGTSSKNNSFAFAVDFKYDDLDDVDYIGGDSVMLYCRDDEEGFITGYVTSLQGTRGQWQGIRSCPTGHYFIGFRLRVYPELGTWGDDFGVDNIQLACSDGRVLDGLNGLAPTAPNVESKREKEDETSVVRKWVEKKGRWVEAVRLRPDTEAARLKGSWGSWAYCSPNLYVTAIRTVVEEGHVGDDAGLTDVTLYCA